MLGPQLTHSPALSIRPHFFNLTLGGCRFVLWKYTSVVWVLPVPQGNISSLSPGETYVKPVPKASYPQKLPFRTFCSLHFHLQNLLLGLFDNANSHLLS